MVRAQRSRKSKSFVVQKPEGQIGERVEAVGPAHFGLVCVDCAKARSKWFMCDYFGKVHIAPTEVEHTQPALSAAIAQVRRCREEQQLADVLVAIERTGVYHRHVQTAFRQAGFETRLVHPYTAKQYRQVADPGNKTDDTDLAAIFRATVNGFGLREPDWPDEYQQLQWLTRFRRDLVQKNAILRCQIREHLHALMPGYADCFPNLLFENASALTLARQTGSATAVVNAGVEGLRQLAPACRRPTLHRILAWAQAAPTEPHPHTPLLRAAIDRFDDDRLAKGEHIRRLEQQCAAQLVRTPYVLLLALPGINLVGAADLAGELGPILHYANANRITGRAGLVPSRYQSDQVDRPNGPLRKRGNRRLRAALLQIADNLVHHNNYYRARHGYWKQKEKNACWIRIKVAKAFSRLLLVMLTARCVYPHPSCQPRHYLVEKLLAWHQAHGSETQPMLEDLEQALRQLPARMQREEGQTLARMLKETQQRRRGPVALGQIIPVVLARLGLNAIQSEQDLG